MKTKGMILIGLLLATMTMQAAGDLPQGKWTVEQITIEKNVDGKIQLAVYNSAETIQSHIPCPNELEINGQNIVLRYSDEREESAEYTLESDQLTILIAVGNQTYKYEIKNDTLTLTANYQYVNNDLIARKSEQISEKRVIILKLDNK